MLRPPTSAPLGRRIPELSDIREVSNSSRATIPQNVELSEDNYAKESKPATQNSTHQEHRDARSETASSEYATPMAQADQPVHQRLGSHATSTISLPLQEIPERRSSISILNRSAAGSRHASMHDLPRRNISNVQPQSTMLASDRRAESPVRDAAARSAQSSEALRVSPSRTFVRTTPPHDILENGSSQHPRLEMSVNLPSPLFVGGGTIEGQVELKIDPISNKKSKLSPLLISKLCIDIVGVEEISDGRHTFFLSLASELFDEKHPPPPALITSQTPQKGSELFWETRPAQAIVPFCINLPLKLGPPPYLSKNACIRYLLCPTVIFKVAEKRSIVRHTWNIQMLTVHDPEKVLGSLATPLLASETALISQNPGQTVKLTAGLHRQTWINGGFLFADIHVVNNTSKVLKKIDLYLDKTILWYSHAAAGTAGQHANHLRIPKKTDVEVVSTTTIKKSREWKGIQAQSSETKTCELEIPRGHVTIGGGRFFEVRYFVRVVVTINMFKTIAVQLPISVIHINSIDILPNSLAQVAASIEAKRSHLLHRQGGDVTHFPYRQGQVFTAAQRQSLDRASNGKNECGANDIQALMRDLDNSPRRNGQLVCHGSARKSTTVTTGSNENMLPARASIASHHHHNRHPSCYHCHLPLEGSAKESQSEVHSVPKLPRLQVSTSGLGFSESEFEIPEDSPPRKVMLSEMERKMINQQRELRLRRQWSTKLDQTNGLSRTDRGVHTSTSLTGWRNVAAIPDSELSRVRPGSRDQSMYTRRDNIQMDAATSKNASRRAEPIRMRSKTNPEGLRSSLVNGRNTQQTFTEYSRARKEIRSLDRGSRMPDMFNVADDGAVFGFPKSSGDRTYIAKGLSYGTKH